MNQRQERVLKFIFFFNLAWKYENLNKKIPKLNQAKNYYIPTINKHSQGFIWFLKKQPD